MCGYEMDPLVVQDISISFMPDGERYSVPYPTAYRGFTSVKLRRAAV